MKLSNGKYIDLNEILFITSHLAVWRIQFKSGQWLEISNDEKAEIDVEMSIIKPFVE